VRGENQTIETERTNPARELGSRARASGVACSPINCIHMNYMSLGLCACSLVNCIYALTVFTHQLYLLIHCIQLYLRGDCIYSLTINRWAHTSKGLSSDREGGCDNSLTSRTR
jgi:hypothetical protein